MMHPIEEAIEFLLNHVKRHGDPPVQEKAEDLLQRIAIARREYQGQLADLADEGPLPAGEGQGPNVPVTAGAALAPPPEQTPELDGAKAANGSARPQ